MFTVCVCLVFHSKYVQFPIICSLQYNININPVEVDPHSDSLHVKKLTPVVNNRRNNKWQFIQAFKQLIIYNNIQGCTSS